MTTIATDGLTIAGDSMNMLGASTKRNMNKIFRINDELFGIAGDASFIDYLQMWVDEDCINSELPDNTNIIRVTKDGVYSYSSHNCGKITYHNKIAAIGSGQDYAIGAMLIGASPKKAVQAAAQCDPYTGGRIKTLNLYRNHT